MKDIEFEIYVTLHNVRYSAATGDLDLLLAIVAQLKAMRMEHPIEFYAAHQRYRREAGDD